MNEFGLRRIDNESLAIRNKVHDTHSVVIQKRKNKK